MGLGPHGTILHSISKAFNQLFWPGSYIPDQSNQIILQQHLLHPVEIRK